MSFQPNSKIIGAFVVGLALVSGAYLATNFAQPSDQYAPAQEASAVSAAPARVAIDVTDENGNGIEDWRDELVVSEPVILTNDQNGTSTYTPPDTLTGKTGVNFIQNVVSAGALHSNTEAREQVIGSTIDELIFESSHEIYDTPDILIIEEWDEEDLVTYANAVAVALVENGKSDLDNELLILRDIINRNDKERITELETLSEIYAEVRDIIIATPVPGSLVKEHLDLINSLHAIHHDIHGMALAYADPAYSLLRLKRYEGDALGLKQSLENMYESLEPYANLFTTDDPAVFFVNFNPRNNVRI